MTGVLTAGSVTTRPEPALVWDGEARVGIRDVPAPPQRPGWVRIGVAYAGLCGTDLHIASGDHSRARPGCVLGHEFSGHLLEPLDGLPVGSPVFANPMVHCGVCPPCRQGQVHICVNLTAIGVDYPGAMSRVVSVPSDAVFGLPPGTNMRHAALVEPLAVGIRALRRGQVEPESRVHVVGAGPVGTVIALLARHAGAAAVTLSERSVERAAVVRGLGFEVLAVEDADADVVFDAAGHPSVSAVLLSALRPAGTAVVVGAYDAGTHPLDLLGLMFGEHTVIGTRVYTEDDIRAAVDLMTAGHLPLDALISGVLPLRRAPEAIADLRQGRGMKVLVDLTAGVDEVLS